MRRFWIFLPVVLAALLLVPLLAQAADLAFVSVPNVLRPGKYYEITVESPASGNAALEVLDGSSLPIHTIYTGYPMNEGTNILGWDGRKADQSILEEGDYTLALTLSDGSRILSPMRIGAPYPMLTHLTQSDSLVTDTAVDISFVASEDGTLFVHLLRYDNDTQTQLSTMEISKGQRAYSWSGELGGERVPNGQYALVFTLRAANGNESMAEHVLVEVVSPMPPSGDSASFVDVYTTPAPNYTEPIAQATPIPLLSPPYSSIDSGTFWSMTPGELDDAKIWEMMMQPIVVYDGGIKAGVKGHAYLMENPDGTGKKVAQLHTQSQGVHVIGQPNEYGYVLVEAFSNYDREYYPATKEEQAHAFELKQGYVRASHLKTVDVMTDMALLIDKLTQRMYLFIDGVRVTELVISTGIWKDPKDMLFETVPGEFITVSHTGALVDGNMTSEMAIRINGGILFHEVPHKTNADGTFNYSSFEGYLGTKQSHGCIRVQRLKNPDGYNQRWLWENLKRGKPYRVIIWDDQNRFDTPGTWYPNPS